MRYSTSNNNQLASTSQAVGAVGYDAAGNVLYDGVNVYLYDGEGRICAVYAYTTPESMTQYVYDAEGDRVAKWAITSFSCNISSNGNAPSNAFILGQGGEQLDETDGLGNELHSNTFGNGRLLYTYDANFTEWGAALSDWLGTKRIQVDPDTVTNLTTFTSLPFGNGLTSSGYGEDSTDLHFTGKPHDWESTNDYFGARYYGSSMGRFLSPDPDTGTLLHIMNPQRWNMYAYALNNPLTMTDPTGKDAAAVNFSGMVADLGHEAIVSINPDGTAQFASFGPAQKTAGGGWGLDEPGQVQTSTALPTIQFGANGLPTDASMTALKDKLADIEHVSPSTVRINYFKTTPQETANLNAWIAQQKANAGSYKFCTRNCANFTARGLVAAGVLDQNQANHASPEPNDFWWQLQDLQSRQSCARTSATDSQGNSTGWSGCQ